MRVKSINLPSSQRFPCSKRDVKQHLADTIIDYVEFRHTMVNLERYAHLDFDGHVLAIADTTRARDHASLYLFPIKTDQYPDSAAEAFRSELLPRLREWLEEQAAKSETEKLGIEEFFFIWEDGAHQTKTITFDDSLI